MAHSDLLSSASLATVMQFRHSLLPLFAADFSQGNLDDPRKFRYLGVSYHINDQGNIATCAHIVNAVKPNETLVAIEMYGTSSIHKVEDVRCHAIYDFAVGLVDRERYEVIPIHGKKEIFIGADVMSYGFTSGGTSAGRNVLMPRLFKGHIVRTHETPCVPSARSTCELSYPSHNGFSGAPVLLNAPQSCLVAMLFSNFESTISLHKLTEVGEDGSRFSEEIHKVVELGIAHTAFDVRSFLRDLGITRVALDMQHPDALP